MNKSARAIAILLCFATYLSCGPRGDSVTYLERLQAGDAASVRGDYVEAEKQYLAALAESEKDGPASSRVQTALHYLGFNYMTQGKLGEAEAAYQRQLQVAEKVYGAESPDMLSPLSDITLLYIKERRFDEAGRYNERALKLAGEVSSGEYKAAVELTGTYRDLIVQGKAQ